MSRQLRFALLGGCALALMPLAPALAQAQIPGNIEFIVGSSPGGGYDTYARLIAVHLPERLEGSPSVIVQNMPGAGSALAAEFITNSAETDGSVIGAIFPGAVIGPIFTDNFEGRYDPQDLQYIATANVSSRVCATYGSDAPTAEELQSGSLILGASAPGGSTYDYAYLFRNAVNENVDVVPGYPGTNDILVAMERGEVDGICGIDFSSLLSSAAASIGDEMLHIVVQFSVADDTTLNDLGAIPFQDMIAEADNEAVQLIIDQQVFGRPYIVSPDTPPEIVELLRAAFADMFDDPEFVAEAEDLQLDLRWAGGAELDETVQRIFASDPTVVERARELLSPE